MKRTKETGDREKDAKMAFRNTFFWVVNNRPEWLEELIEDKKKQILERKVASQNVVKK